MIGTTRSMSVTAADLVPGLLDLVDVGHVGHRAAGVEVGEDHPLVVAGEHVGRLGHEVHAAEDDVGRRSLSAANRASLNESPTAVGPADDLVALVVVTEDDEPVAERRPWRRRCVATSSSGVARV